MHKTQPGPDRASLNTNVAKARFTGSSSHYGKTLWVGRATTSQGLGLPRHHRPPRPRTSPRVRQANDGLLCASKTPVRENVSVGGVVRRVVGTIGEILVGRGGRVVGRAAAVPASGDEHGVGQSGHARVLDALLGAAGGARNHADDGRPCLGLVLIHEVETVADKGPLVEKLPRFLHPKEQQIVSYMSATRFPKLRHC